MDDDRGHKVHIGIVSPEFPPDIGGVETYAYEYSKALVALGHTVTVFTTVDKVSYTYFENFTVLPILHLRRRLDSAALALQKVDAWHVMNAAYSWLTLDSEKPVVISVHGNDFLKPYLNIGRPDLSRFPILWRFTKQLEDIDKLIGRWVTARTIENSIFKARRILTNSRYTEKVFLNKFPTCIGKTYPTMVGLGSDFLHLDHKDNTTVCTRLITISRLSEPRKNINLVLNALGNLKENYIFKYTIIGDGHQRSGLEALAHRQGLDDLVEFRGFVERNELINELSRSDLFILTSSVLPGSHEGFGIVYLEAAACGTPSLAARLAGAAEAVKEDVSGLFVEKADTSSIEDALIRFFEKNATFNPEKCQAFARSFTWEKIVRKALPHYVHRQ